MKRLFSAALLLSAVGSFALIGQGCSSATPREAKFEEENTATEPTDDVPVDQGGFAQTGKTKTKTADPLAGCSTSQSEVARAPVYLEFVVDASGSMSGEKWQAQIAALSQIFSEMHAQADTKLGVGLIMFGESVPYPRKGKDVFINYVDDAQFKALNDLIAKSGPTGSTPTKEALTGGYSVLKNFVPLAPLEEGGKKIVVLMTDGAPNDDTGIDALVDGAHNLVGPEGPIDTFAVGVGLSTSDEISFMGMVAQKGGTAPKGCIPTSTDPKTMCFFPIDPGAKTVQQLTQDFVDTINRIRLRASCEYSLASDNAAADPKKVNVVFVDDAGKVVTVPQDPVDGWTYDDPENPTKVTLHGAACEKAGTDLTSTVKVVLGCATVVQ